MAGTGEAKFLEYWFLYCKKQPWFILLISSHDWRTWKKKNDCGGFHRQSYDYVSRVTILIHKAAHNCPHFWGCESSAQTSIPLKTCWKPICNSNRFPLITQIKLRLHGKSKCYREPLAVRLFSRTMHKHVNDSSQPTRCLHSICLIKCDE